MLTTLLFSMLVGQAGSAQPQLAIIDVVSESLSQEDERELLHELRQEFQWQGVFGVLRQEELEDARKQIDPNRVKWIEERERQRRALASLLGQLREARQLYSESRFEESLSILESAWHLAKSTYLTIEVNAVLELLSYRAANQLFLQKLEEAKDSLRLIQFLSKDWVLEPQRFPPSLIELEVAVRNDNGDLPERSFRIDLKGVSLRLLGRELVSSSSPPKVEFGLPEWKLLEGQVLWAEKPGHAPQAFELFQLPDRIRLEAYVEEKFETGDLFKVLGSLSPSNELLQFLQSRNLDVVLLLNAEKDLSSRWIVRGQLFRASDRSRTPVVEAVGSSLSESARLLARRLLVYVKPSGDFVEPQGVNFVERAEAPKPIYKKWWFWTAVGVGVAGAGTGAYYLLKPEPTLSFDVRRGE